MSRSYRKGGYDDEDYFEARRIQRENEKRAARKQSKSYDSLERRDDDEEEHRIDAFVTTIKKKGR